MGSSGRALSFGPGAADVDLLRQLAAIARAASAPIVAAADWRTEDLVEWDALRRRPDARYVGLAAPRFLLRLPYGGPDGEPSDVPRFQELSTAPAHEEYLWGNSAVLDALLHGEAFAFECGETNGHVVDGQRRGPGQRVSRRHTRQLQVAAHGPHHGIVFTGQRCTRGGDAGCGS